MQVMNNDSFNQNEVLIGGAGKTKGYKVSDDAMLMSMLSTGFYANPHRAMVQEVMFNAWDAHRMGKCQDTPIDIFINENSGFTVRDYGPGIHDEMMEDVYCTYAASTKRDDEDQTGGFGLGSKSPWSYTESFTVTSHHQGIKTMYLMSRVSDEAQGKPGMTQLMSFQTEETGLAVAVPLQNDADLLKTYDLVKDILYLSGIKACIHYKDCDPELIESKSMVSGEYFMEDRNNDKHNHHQRLYAVYGGVRYAIPDREEYKDEFKFMSLISEICPLYIGFAPHSLSPLPNREGLNMSQKTKENIRIGLELCMEKFQSVFEPLVHAYFREKFDRYKAQNIQPHFVLYHSILNHTNRQILSISDFETKMSELVPFNTDPAVWKISLRLMTFSFKYIIDVIGKKKWLSILLYHFVRVYPDHKYMAFNCIKDGGIERHIDSRYSHSELENKIASWVLPKQLNHLHQFEQKMAELFPESEGFAPPTLRFQERTNSTVWDPMVRHRNAPRKLSKRYAHSSTRSIDNKEKVLAPVTFSDPIRIWSSNKATPVTQFMLSNTVILATTVASLNATDIHLKEYFSKPTISSSDFTASMDYNLIPAYVVNPRKGGYDAALKILQDLGFNVIEGEVIAPAVTTPKKKGTANVKQYHRVNPTRDTTWQEPEIDTTLEGYDPVQHGVPLTKPTHYLHLTKAAIADGYGYSRQTPHHSLVRLMVKEYPDIAMVNHQAQADALEKAGVPKFEEAVKEWVKNSCTNVYRFRNMVRVIYVRENGSLSDILIKHPTIQSAMGIAAIKPDDTRFWFELDMIDKIRTTRYFPLWKLFKEMEKLVEDTFIADPQQSKIKRAIEAAGFFSGSSLLSKWHRLDTDEQQEFAFKLARFIRTY